jgi:hypothetical protein
MHNQYVDRGIIKWAPFDALVGYSQMIKELKFRLGKKDIPILSEDQLEELNGNLGVAYMSQSEITIHFYENGYIKETFGKIKKIDYINHLIVLTTLEKIKASSVVEIYFY